jgi:hypothetical protein
MLKNLQKFEKNLINVIENIDSIEIQLIECSLSYCASLNSKIVKHSTFPA